MNGTGFQSALLVLLSLLAGAAIATQVGINAKLGLILKSPLLGTSIAFMSSFIVTLTIALAASKQYPNLEAIRSLPVYLWISGGLLSSFGVVMIYYLSSKIGIGTTLSYALTSQLVVSAMLAHFGCFDLPTKPVDAVKLTGITIMIVGVVLANCG